LDGDYTVFGKVIKGMEIVDRIAAVPTDVSDWPLQNVFIKDISIIKQ
jgi:cyclophilin family peptidyl-prolyl cis-trans isomerase